MPGDYKYYDTADMFVFYIYRVSLAETEISPLPSNK